jgi:glycosyltransferase involved in cell wall biosynthesis
VKVALIHTHFGGRAGGGGGARQMTELALSLKRAGHEAVICCHDHDTSEEFAGVREAGLEILSVRKGEINKAIGPRNALHQTWREMPRVADLVPDDVDVINAHATPGIHAGRLAAKRLDVPLVWTRNDYTVFEFALMPHEAPVPAMNLVQRGMRMIVSFSDLLDARASDAIAVLDGRNERMVKRAYRREAVVIRSGPAEHFYNPPPRAQAREALGIDDDTFLALGFGVMYIYRRFEDMIEAISMLDDMPQIQGLIIGSAHMHPDYAEKVRKLIDQKGLSDRIKLDLRSFTEEELVQIYAAADVYVYPNDLQTWGLSALEAIVAGTPAIVSRGAGVHEVLGDQSAVELVDALDPPAIRDALVRIASDPAAYETSETREWIRENLNNTRYGEQMAELFTRLIEQRKK